MPVLLALATALFLLTAPWPERQPATAPGLAGSTAVTVVVHHEAAMVTVAADPALRSAVTAVTPVPVVLTGRISHGATSCTRDGIVATWSAAMPRQRGAMLRHLRRLLGDPPGLGLADGSASLPASDRKRYPLPCTIAAGAVVLLGWVAQP